MKTYIDWSALVPVYVPERFSKEARVAIRVASQVPFGALHQLEVPNAFELLDLDQVFARAGELSKLHTAKFLARSLFVSGGDRQLAVAKASGLKIRDIKRRVRSRSS